MKKKRRGEQKTRKRIGEQRHTRTRRKRRAGKSERVQLPTGNGKQTKRKKRGEGKGARTSRCKRDGHREREGGKEKEKSGVRGRGEKTREENDGIGEMP